MDLLYSSTRNSEKKITASQAILKGLADDGGLFVPESIPALDVSVEELSKMSYQQVAYEVMKLFLTDFTEEELKYNAFFFRFGYLLNISSDPQSDSNILALSS